jgi:hypothetical protein
MSCGLQRPTGPSWAAVREELLRAQWRALEAPSTDMRSTTMPKRGSVITVSRWGHSNVSTQHLDRLVNKINNNHQVSDLLLSNFCCIFILLNFMSTDVSSHILSMDEESGYYKMIRSKGK